MKSYMLLFILLALAAPAAQGQYQLGPVTLRNVTSTQSGFICNVSVPSDMDPTVLVRKAYIFNTENKRILTIIGGTEDPREMNTRNYTAPDMFKGGKKYPIFFMLPPEFESGRRRWKHAVVVFGKGNDLVARVYPQDELKKYNFPEKGIAKLVE